MKNKNLLFAIGFLTFFCSTGVSAQLLLNENFDGPTFPPSGWSNSTYTGINNTSASGPVFQWFRMFSGAGNPYAYDPNNPTYTAYPNPTGVTAHSGNGMAWNNTYYYSSGNYGVLISPQINYTTTGGNTLGFWLYTNYASFGYSTILTVYYNTSPSLTGATSIASFNPNGSTASTGWKQFTYTLPAGFASGDYILFKAQNTTGTYYLYSFDMLMDDVTITHHAPCTGTPSGTIVNGTPCPGSSFTMYYSDTTETNLTYLWQQSADNITWYNIASTASVTTSITAATYFRVVVTCTNAGGGVDSASTLVNVAPFYFCYCPDSSAGSHLANIGNVTIKNILGATLLNNGSASPVTNNYSAVNDYTDFDYSVNAPTLYKDSSYTFSISQIQNTATWNQSPINVYIDLNRDGFFTGNELVLLDSTTSSASPTVTHTFQIPSNANVGPTGMRVIIDPTATSPYSTNDLDPCQPHPAGEIEDYIINISYSPCNGAANAGIASSSDTLMCPGDNSGHYTFTLTDTSYEKDFINLSRNWQTSTDAGLTWNNIVASQNVDVINLQYTAPSWFRTRMICTNSHDTTYSNIVKINNDSSYRCYCYSMASGGFAFDSTDIGAFRFGQYFFTTFNPTNNSHLNNVNATNGRYSYTHAPIMDLYADSTYPVMVYDVMKSAIDANAKITLFIDYNNDLTYSSLASDSERVWTSYTNDTNFFDTTFIHTKVNLVTGMPTGMRLIINNNTNPNIPSDDACGPYTSGETQDFVVKFHPRWESVAGISQNIQNLSLYPNPTKGRFKFEFSSAAGIKNLRVNVSNITGQQVLVRNFDNVSGAFSSELDLSTQPRGVYFIEFMADGERLVRKLSVN